MPLWTETESFILRELLFHFPFVPQQSQTHLPRKSPCRRCLGVTGKAGSTWGLVWIQQMRQTQKCVWSLHGPVIFFKINHPLLTDSLRYTCSQEDNIFAIKHDRANYSLGTHINYAQVLLCVIVSHQLSYSKCDRIRFLKRRNSRCCVCTGKLLLSGCPQCWIRNKVPLLRLLSPPPLFIIITYFHDSVRLTYMIFLKKLFQSHVMY